MANSDSEKTQKRDIGTITGFFRGVKGLTKDEVEGLAKDIEALKTSNDQDYVGEKITELVKLPAKDIQEHVMTMLKSRVEAFESAKQVMLEDVSGMESKLMAYQGQLLEGFDSAIAHDKNLLEHPRSINAKQGLAHLVRHVIAEAKGSNLYNPVPVAGLEKIQRIESALMMYESGLQLIIQGAPHGSFYLPDRVDTRKPSIQKADPLVPWAPSLYALTKILQHIFMRDEQARAVVDADRRAAEAEKNYNNQTSTIERFKNINEELTSKVAKHSNKIEELEMDKGALISDKTQLQGERDKALVEAAKQQGVIDHMAAEVKKYKRDSENANEQIVAQYDAFSKDREGYLQQVRELSEDNDNMRSVVGPLEDSLQELSGIAARRSWYGRIAATAALALAGTLFFSQSEEPEVIYAPVTPVKPQPAIVPEIVPGEGFQYLSPGQVRVSFGKESFDLSWDSAERVYEVIKETEELLHKKFSAEERRSYFRHHLKTTSKN